MLLTFTRRASDEMLRRARRALGETGSRMLGTVWGGTFHSVANRLLRSCAPMGKPSGSILDPDFTVIDQSDAEDLMDASRHDNALGSKEKRFPRKQTCLSIYPVASTVPIASTIRWRRSFRGASSGSRNCGYFSNRIPKQSRSGTCSITTISSSIGFICLAMRRSSLS